MLVKLRYFKPNGTWYCDGSYETQHTQLWDIFDEVRNLRIESTLPGVRGNDWLITVDVPDHPSNHPVIIGAHELNWVQPEIPFPISMITSIQPKYTCTHADHLARLMTLFNEGFWDNERGNWGDLKMATARYRAEEENDRKIGIMHTRIKGLEGE